MKPVSKYVLYAFAFVLYSTLMYGCSAKGSAQDSGRPVCDSVCKAKPTEFEEVLCLCF